MDVDKSAALLEGILDTLKQIQDELRAQPKMALPEQNEFHGTLDKLEAAVSRGVRVSNVRPSGRESRPLYIEPECNDLVISIPIGSFCKRQGCSFRYSGIESNGVERCVFHPSSMIYYDRFQFYTCCKQVRRLGTVPFAGDIKGCQTKNSHIFDNGGNDHSQSDAASFIEHVSLLPLPVEVEHSNRDSPGSNFLSTNSSGNQRDSLCDSIELGSEELLTDLQRPLKKRDSLFDLEHSGAWQTEMIAKTIETVLFQDWIAPLRESPLLTNKMLKKELGDAWMIPDDGRLELTFCRQYLEKLSTDVLQRRIETLKHFRDQMVQDVFVDFKIVDDFTTEPSGARSRATYRLGRKMRTTGPCRVPLVGATHSLQRRNPTLLTGNDVQEAPWRRFIFCQGITAGFDGMNIPDNNKVAPFLDRISRSHNSFTCYSAILDHSHCRRLSPNLYNPAEEKSNPYYSLEKAFHITFYEILPREYAKHEKSQRRGRWNYGPLYDSFLDELLCESALTMIEVLGDAGKIDAAMRKADNSVLLDANDNWTVLLLTPPLFIAGWKRTPSSMSDPLHVLCLEVLATTFIEILERWASLQEHLEALLNERSAITNPLQHDELLWDDETFSRSRKYFWAIQCLTEFRISINDNILQWEMYYNARVKPYQDADMLDRSSLRHLESIETNCTGLRTIRSYFVDQLESTKALRDGLFNASAVVESRASSRLGENVKLLTFVSIFFLPLAFCTSLWSVNETFSRTVLIYTIFIVAISTYMLVFNLNNIVTQGSKAYRPLRQRLVDRMKTTGKNNYSFWARTGRRFDNFRPRHEKAQPSEWWIIVFFIKSIWNLARKVIGKGDKPRVDEGSSSDEWSDLRSFNSVRSSLMSWEPPNMPIGTETPEGDIPVTVATEDPKGTESALGPGSKSKLTTTNKDLASRNAVDHLDENFVTILERVPAQARQPSPGTAPQTGAMNKPAITEAPGKPVEQQMRSSRTKNENIADRAWTRAFGRKMRKFNSSNGDTV